MSCFCLQILNQQAKNITEYNKHKNYLCLIRTRKKCYKYLIEQNFYKLRWGQNDKIALCFQYKSTIEMSCRVVFCLNENHIHNCIQNVDVSWSELFRFIHVAGLNWVEKRINYVRMVNLTLCICLCSIQSSFLFKFNFQ